MINTMKKL